MCDSCRTWTGDRYPHSAAPDPQARFGDDQAEALLFRDNQKTCSATISDTTIGGCPSFEWTPVKPVAALGGGLKGQALRASTQRRRSRRVAIVGRYPKLLLHRPDCRASRVLIVAQ